MFNYFIAIYILGFVVFYRWILNTVDGVFCGKILISIVGLFWPILLICVIIYYLYEQIKKGSKENGK